MLVRCVRMVDIILHDEFMTMHFLLSQSKPTYLFILLILICRNQRLRAYSTTMYDFVTWNGYVVNFCIFDYR